jgi:hypothetical protein
MTGKEAESEIDKVPVSNNAISRCVDNISHNIEDVFSEILNRTNFALQVNKLTDITLNLNCWHLYNLKMKVR